MLSTDIGSLNCSHVVPTLLLIDVNDLIWILDACLESRAQDKQTAKLPKINPKIQGSSKAFIAQG
jgi:hypothetical protein